MRTTRLLAASAFVLGLSAAIPAAQTQPRPTFRTGTQIVSVDVIVRDGSGGIVRGLTKDDFEVTEDGKPQEIRSFTFEEIAEHPKGVETAELLAGAKEKLAEEIRRAPSAAPAKPAAAPAAAAEEPPKPMTSDQLAGRRLIVLLFDIASMQPEDVQRAVDSASAFVDKKMTPAEQPGSTGSVANGG